MGSATLWVLVVALLAVVTATAVGTRAAATIARHRAASAADLAALAAATTAVEGPARACARARRVAQASGARVSACRLVDAVADVTVTVRVPALARGAARGHLASARARAGPADG